MKKIYPISLSDGWYPHDPKECEESIQKMLSEIGKKKILAQRQAAIVGHAGWFYSGKTAVYALSLLSSNNPQPDAIILIGGHLSPYDMILYSSYEEVETPLGNITVDLSLTEELVKNTESRKSIQTIDNTIEVNLPFLRYFFPNTPVVLLRCPPNSMAVELGKNIAHKMKEKKANWIVIGSADLTHYGRNYGFYPAGSGKEAVRWVKEINDKNLIDLVLKGNSLAIAERSIQDNSSCSGGAMACVSSFAVENQLKAELLLYYTSYDIYPAESFVGYASIVF